MVFLVAPRRSLGWRYHHGAVGRGDQSGEAPRQILQAGRQRRALSARDAVLPTGTAFHTWEYERRTKAKGGRVYISVGHRGDVAVHEGYVTTKEARRDAKGEAVAEHPVRPEASAILNDYVDLHRHAAVRAKLADAPDVALRVAVAQLVAGSPLWSVRVASQRAAADAVTESVEISLSEGQFDAKRRAILAMLAFDPEAPTVTGGNGYDEGLTQLFVKLTALSDADVLAVLAVVVGEGTRCDPAGGGA